MIVNIDEEVDGDEWNEVEEQRGVTLGVNETIRKKKGFEFIIPGAKSLFGAIESLLKTTYVGRSSGINEA